MSKFIDITGNKYNMLTVVKRVEGKIPTWECVCDCGNKTTVRGYNLKSGAVKSCGCLKHKPRRTHGMSNTPLYGVWNQMKERCENPNHKSFKNYGGRGIAVCDEWRDSFSAFANWAMANGYEEGLTIERIHVDDGYKPSNCTWITKSEQVQNRRMNYKIEYNCEVKNLAQWCKEFGVRYELAHNRIYKLGWDFEKAMTTPCDIKKRNKRGD